MDIEEQSELLERRLCEEFLQAVIKTQMGEVAFDTISAEDQNTRGSKRGEGGSRAAASDRDLWSERDVSFAPNLCQRSPAYRYGCEDPGASAMPPLLPASVRDQEV